MNTKLLMTAAAIVLGVAGLVLSFLPEEVAQYLHLPAFTPIIFQILGATYLGFAMLNWIAKGNLIGGIYSRPVAMGNFMHFLVGGLALIKFVLHHSDPYLWGGVVVYLVFAGLFGWVMLRGGPSLKGKGE